MPGAFDASPEPEFDLDEFRTAEEIQRNGEALLQWLAAAAESTNPPAVDRSLILELHRRWFETTFPADAGRFRTSLVLNRKGTAVAVDAILPAVTSACGNWNYRRSTAPDLDGAELVSFIVSEANGLTVEIYDIHPFLDGNTRTTWHLRNYVLMYDGLRPLLDLTDQSEYEAAWWAATPHDHDELDAIVLRQLAVEDR